MFHIIIQEQQILKYQNSDVTSELGQTDPGFHRGQCLRDSLYRDVIQARTKKHPSLAKVSNHHLFSQHFYIYLVESETSEYLLTADSAMRSALHVKNTFKSSVSRRKCRIKFFTPKYRFCDVKGLSCTSSPLHPCLLYKVYRQSQLYLIP